MSDIDKSNAKTKLQRPYAWRTRIKGLGNARLVADHRSTKTIDYLPKTFVIITYSRRHGNWRVATVVSGTADKQWSSFYW